jgi:hypothetical protein
MRTIHLFLSIRFGPITTRPSEPAHRCTTYYLTVSILYIIPGLLSRLLSMVALTFFPPYSDPLLSHAPSGASSSEYTMDKGFRQPVSLAEGVYVQSVTKKAALARVHVFSNRTYPGDSRRVVQPGREVTSFALLLNGRCRCYVPGCQGNRYDQGVPTST